jgi:hypothetical protein
MVEYLQKIFGAQIKSVDYRLPKNTPIYLLEGYSVKKLIWGDHECVVITPQNTVARLPVLKKHYLVIKNICDLPCALNLEKLTVEQRENLVSNNIPFISVQQQVYLPFWGSAFLERLKPEVIAPKRMAPTTQLVFLHVFYRLFSGEQNVNSTSISSELGVPKSSISRAVQELETYGLLKLYAEGTNKWLGFAADPNETLAKAMDIMRSPVSQVVFLKELPEELSYKYGGIKALSMISMLGADERDGAIVFDKIKAQRIPKEKVISKRTFDDFGGVISEVWRYDPGLLSKQKTVDDISLLLCLQNDEDERVQNELDGIRKKYGLEVR